MSWFTDDGSLDKPCEHKFMRPTADGNLEVCSSCGVIIRALTEDGRKELNRLKVKWNRA